jgi:phage replication-related protein YjqB (UPF0714/DUF867 family)
MDRYKNFISLADNEREGEDYRILCRQRDSGIAVMAPHGGGIEPGTLDIADALAGNEYSFYAFKGMKKKGNEILHLTSNRFDEPIGLQISKNALIVVSIHGNRDKGEMVFIGGRNRALKEKIVHALTTAGFPASISDEPGLRGIKPENICNRCTSGEGVQLEISRGLREKMFEHFEYRSRRKKTNVFYSFVETIKRVLLDIEENGSYCR